jgi:hypothetical protein
MIRVNTDKFHVTIFPKIIKAAHAQTYYDRVIFELGSEAKYQFKEPKARVPN